MFDRLQQKWKVNGLQLALILCTFAIGGSLTGYAGRRLMPLLGIEQDWLWIIVYIIVVTLLWPLSVLLVSIPFGQFRFFVQYLKKIGKRMGLTGVGSQESKVRSQQPGITSNFKPQTSDPCRIAIFASGAGSNAQKIIEHFRYSKKARVTLIVCNKPGAAVLSIAATEHIPVLLLEKEKFSNGNGYAAELKEKEIDLIVLAGFLWKIPAALIKAFPNRILNIHPALLPGYGGKGMYGLHVHQAVIDNKEKESGISIHYVDEIYDHGQVIFQARCPLLEHETAASLAQRIHKLEHEHYPRIIERLIEGNGSF
jgi:formyltetrahydrofolate-dependent phosphoribosylglycinamide formyltransferase